MVLDGLSLYWTSGHDLFDGPRMRPVVETTETRQEFEQGKRQERFMKDRRIGEVGHLGPRSTIGMRKRGTVPHALDPRDPRYRQEEQPY
jgi:hypothetical protein